MCSSVCDDVTDFEVRGFTIKKKKSQYLEKEILFFHQIKKFIHYTLSAIVLHKYGCYKIYSVTELLNLITYL